MVLSTASSPQLNCGSFGRSVQTVPTGDDLAAENHEKRQVVTMIDFRVWGLFSAAVGLRVGSLGLWSPSTRSARIPHQE